MISCFTRSFTISLVSLTATLINPSLISLVCYNQKEQQVSRQVGRLYSKQFILGGDIGIFLSTQKMVNTEMHKETRTPTLCQTPECRQDLPLEKLTSL